LLSSAAGSIRNNKYCIHHNSVCIPWIKVEIHYDGSDKPFRIIFTPR
jgi:hypothetical protein